MDTPAVNSFESQKQTFFFNLALRNRSALRLHQAEGLWQRNDEDNREWGNVSEHCLVEAARVQVFAELLGLDEDLTADLTTAAALHDFYKKSEIELVKRDSSLVEESYLAAQKMARGKLVSAGFTQRVVNLAGAVGHDTSPVAEAILAQETLEDEDVAYLIMHYVDDYTIDNQWSAAAEVRDDLKINDLDRRLDKAESNPRYQSYQPRPDGEPALSAQRRIGHLVEQKLTELVTGRNYVTLDPPDLPVYIDSLIGQKIQDRPLSDPQAV